MNLHCAAWITTEAVPGSAIADWIMYARQCGEPAAVIETFVCENGHGGERPACAAHAASTGLCGHCADEGVTGTAEVISSEPVS